MAELKNIRIAVSGIYDYAREELESLNVPLPGQGAPEWAGGKQFYKVYRPAPVLACAVQKFASLPLTHHHPNGLVNGVNFRDLTVGWTGETPVVDYIPDADEVGIRSTCILYDDEALRAYRNGEVQLSPGYTAVFEWKQGTTHGGVPYDIVMKEILDVNHVALLPAGRGGEYAAVLDGAGAKPSVFEIARAKDGAPDGNDNASKEHESREEETAKKRVFGTEYKGYTGTRAIDKLLQEKQGFVQNAFSREDIGGIDVVYGKITDPKTLKGYGLAKIFAKHPEMTPALISEIIEQGNLEKTYNGYNLNHGGFVVGLNNGYNENGKRVITSNWIVTSFKNEKEKVNDAIASAAAFPPSAGRPGNLFTDEIVIENPYSVKSVFDIARGSVFERAAV